MTPGRIHPGGHAPAADPYLIRLLSDTYPSDLEVIGPDPEQPSPDGPRPFGIDNLTGPRLVTWAARARDLDEAVRRAQTAGYDPGPIIAMSRDSPDGARLRWRMTLTPAGGDPDPSTT